METVENKKRGKVILIVTLIGLIGIFIIYVMWLLFIAREKFLDDDKLEYEIVYYDDSIPGSKYAIEIYNEKVFMTKTNFCSAVDCKKTTQERVDLKYSRENVLKLKRFIDNNFEGKKELELYDGELNSYQKDVLGGVTLSEYFFELAVEEYKYRVEYTRTSNISYDIYYKDNGEILVKKCKIDDDYDI